MWKKNLFKSESSKCTVDTIDGGWHLSLSKLSPDHLFVLVQSLLGHMLDEGWIKQIQLSGNRDDEWRRVQDVDLHLGFSDGLVLFIVALWLHLEIERSTVISSPLSWSLLDRKWKATVEVSNLQSYNRKVLLFILSILTCWVLLVSVLMITVSTPVL